MKKLRVSVVEDDKDLAESFSLMLESCGHEVKIAYSGEEAIKQFRERDFDIAFMDLKLPGMNGVESFMEIRKSKPCARVVMMSGYSMDPLLDKAVRNGVLAVLKKPVDPKEILAMLENIETAK